MKLTRRQKEAAEMVARTGKEGCSVWDLAEAREISYPAAYDLLEGLKEKGILQDVWEAKGNKKKYVYRGPNAGLPADV